jgi:hypothetical protein
LQEGIKLVPGCCLFSSRSISLACMGIRTSDGAKAADIRAEAAARDHSRETIATTCSKIVAEAAGGDAVDAHNVAKSSTSTSRRTKHYDSIAAARQAAIAAATATNPLHQRTASSST